jgi:L-threonylcarbamoyladenylate synthase
MKNGDLIIIPTDTVYGLAARLYDDEALEKIYQIKGMDKSEPIPILCSKMSDLLTIAETTVVTRAIMKNLWPGALTIVMPTTKQFFEMTGEKTIAARMPNHPVALEMIEKHGVLRVTSLNKNGELPMTDIRMIRREFGPYVVEIHPQEFDQSDLTSTILDMSSNEVKILREGTITLDDLQKAIKNIMNHYTARESL